MKRTKEELAKQRAGRKAEAEALCMRFPGAHLREISDDRGLIIEVRCGDDLYIDVRMRGSFDKGLVDGWTEGLVRIRNPVSLGRFIRALTLRYNALVEEMNEAAA